MPIKDADVFRCWCGNPATLTTLGPSKRDSLPDAPRFYCTREHHIADLPAAVTEFRNKCWCGKDAWHTRRSHCRIDADAPPLEIAYFCSFAHAVYDGTDAFPRVLPGGSHINLPSGMQAECLPAPVIGAPTGRPRVYGSAAEKQRAYRVRKSQGANDAN